MISQELKTEEYLHRCSLRSVADLEWGLERLEKRRAFLLNGAWRTNDRMAMEAVHVYDDIIRTRKVILRQRDGFANNGQRKARA